MGRLEKSCNSTISGLVNMRLSDILFLTSMETLVGTTVGLITCYGKYSIVYS